MTKITRTTVQQALEGVLPTEPGLYGIVGSAVFGDHGDAPQSVQGRRIFSFTGREFFEVTDAAAEHDGIVADIKKNGWALALLVPTKD